MKTKPQLIFKGTFLGRLTSSKFGVVASNWLFQGMRYMNFYEVALKIIVDAFLFFILLYIYKNFFSLSYEFVYFGVFIFAHTLNWVFNGHFYVLMRYISPIKINVNEFYEYSEYLKKRVIVSRYISAGAVYGSYCRGALHENSDLDVRVIVNKGFLNGVMGALFCLRERFIAFFKKFPLDIYCFIETESLNKIRKDELPYVLCDKNNLLKDYYEKNKNIQ